MSSKCYRIKLWECANFAAIGSSGGIAKTIPMHPKPEAILSGSDYYNVYSKQYNSIDYPPPAHLDPCIVTNIQSSRYFNPHDYLQTIRYWFYLMQRSLASNVPVEQLLRLVQYAWYQSVWQPGWTRQCIQPNPADLCSLLELPQHILELEDVISIFESSCTSREQLISFFGRAGAPEIGRSDSVESSWIRIQETKERAFGMCYRGHCPYIRPRCLDIPAWSSGWHWYILPYNQVPDAQQM